MRAHRWRRTAAGVMAIGVLAGACGDGDTPEGSATPSPAAAGPAATGAVPSASPTPAAPGTPPGEPAPDTRDGVYVVQPGDNLTSIAEQFDTTVEAIVEANGLEDPNLILVGEELEIPPAS